MFAERLLAHASVGPSTGEPIAKFDEVAVLTPRGRFAIELHGSALRLVGQAADYKIQYSSVMRLFVLARPGRTHTYAVIALDPPIRKGQTYYPYIVIQFAVDSEARAHPPTCPPFPRSLPLWRLQDCACVRLFDFCSKTCGRCMYRVRPQFEVEPVVPEEQAERYVGKLEPKYVGAEAEVFAKARPPHHHLSRRW